jgi:rhamnulokinase
MSADKPAYVAIDLGASGGRVARGGIIEGCLAFDILHRFPNRPVPVGRHLYWNLLELWREIIHGLKLAGERGPVASIGVTTWGVDHALLDADRLQIGLMHCYRDARTDGTLETIEKTMPRGEIYRHTGVQFLPINTLPQLVAARRDAPRLFERAAYFLMLPDLLHYWLCGRMVGEHSNASTTQLYDPRRRAWSAEILEAFGIPPDIMPELVEPGTILGPLLPEIARETGLGGALVVAPATHDTASAVAAVPAKEGDDWAYVSSGTWSLVGIEVPAPVITEASLAENLTNEQGVNGTTRLLKNSGGLFPLQECCHAWGDPDFESLLTAAEAAPSQPLIDINDKRFTIPGIDMPARIQNYCRERGTAPPEGEAAITRALLQSLGDDIAGIIRRIDRLAAHTTRRIHVVGGGSRIGLLNRLLGEATGAEVIAGPIEATTAGNLLVQAAALDEIHRDQIRPIMRRRTN